MTSEILLPDEVISHTDWYAIGGDPNDFLTPVLSGVATYIQSEFSSSSIEYGFAAPTGNEPIERIDAKVEAYWIDSPCDLEVNLWINSAWQGVQALALTNTLQIYTFGGWTGTWTPQQVAASKLKLHAALSGKTGSVAVATLRQVVTARSSGGRMLLVGVGP